MNEKERKDLDQKDAEGLMHIFEAINNDGDEGELQQIADRYARSQIDDQHSLVCNNELFNKELWAIVDDTSREND
ncbi:hypothetical protein [Peribacillus sp. SCS-155]|uniref:hypothetical protein n=1 Tax=Peribacillus sedimenti TaxID=3115297 RepID=UPI003905A3FE